MPDSITINDPDVIELIERVAVLKTHGNRDEAVALGMRAILKDEAGNSDRRSPVGCGKGLVTFFDDVDLTEPTFTAEEAETWAMSTGDEVSHSPDRSAG